MHTCNHTYPGKALNSVLFEAYLSCGGDWTKSKLYLSISEAHLKKKQGRRRWMTRKEMMSRFGDATDDIIERKISDPEIREREVRCHPEAPTRKDPYISLSTLSNLKKHVRASRLTPAWMFCP